MPKKGKERSGRFSKSSFRRLFSRKKKKKQKSTEGEKHTHSSLSISEKKQNIKALAWTPDDIFDQIHGVPVLDQMNGSVLLFEVGDIDRGWVLDFTSETAVISRYDIPGFDQRKPKKAPNGPPASTVEVSGDEGKKVAMKSLPWAWYRDRKIFSKIESGKMSDMAAFVTGKVAVSGDMSAWDKIETTWAEAKKRATERKKMISLEQNAATGAEEQEEVEEVEDEEEEEEDEEAKIIATFKPEKEPMDPRKKAFWMRHFGTDALVSSYLFLWSSAAFVVLAQQAFIHSLGTDDFIKQAHMLANVVSAVMFTVGSGYMIKLSYPETMMLMAYRTMTKDPNEMTFLQRYFTANEFLIATWSFSAGWFAPLLIVALYEFFMLREFKQAALDMFTLIVAVPIMFLSSAPAMPDFMRANNGRGTTYFFDKIWVPLLRLNRNEERLEFFRKHLGSDMLAFVWIIAVAGFLAGVAVTPLVILHPQSSHDWTTFWATMPFTFGSFLLLRSSYPETMNTSIFFSSEDSSVETADTSATMSDSNGEETPLLS